MTVGSTPATPRDRTRERVEAVLRGVVGTGHQQAGRTVGQRRGVARRHRRGLVVGEHRRQLRERRHRGVLAGPLVGLDDTVVGLDRNDLVVEATAVAGRDGALVGAEREPVLRLAADVVLPGDPLGGRTHRKVVGAVLLLDGGVDPVREGSAAHVLDASDGEDVTVAGLDRPRSVDERRQRGTTQPGERRARHRLRKPAGEQRLPGEVAALFVLLVGTAQPEVVPLCGGDARPFDERVEYRDDQILGVGVRQGAVFLCLWRPHRVDDDCLAACHWRSVAGEP